MSELPQALLDQLISLVGELRTESENYLEEHQDAQQWYNRGYANGMLRGLEKLTGQERPAGLQLDSEADIAGHEVMAWGRAYRHGEAMGEKETYEIASQ